MLGPTPEFSDAAMKDTAPNLNGLRTRVETEASVATMLPRNHTNSRRPIDSADRTHQTTTES
jgi:hypothetical protein